MTDDILVSISCITYNHSKYISQCINGFLSQKCNFKFEVLIHDDASTDGTDKIIRRYASKYPDIIKPLYETENQYQNGKPSGSFIWNFPRARGKYIALCEGDDYWTDPLKLQKQVDFLEANPEYSMCFHNASIIKECEYSFLHINVEDRDYSAKELFDSWIVPTASICVKKQAVDNYEWNHNILNGDIFLVLSASACGKIRGMPDSMSAYRVQSNGLTIKRQTDDKISLHKRYLIHYKTLYERFPQITGSSYRKKLSDTHINIGISSYRSDPFYAFYHFMCGLCHSPKRFFQRLLKSTHKHHHA